MVVIVVAAASAPGNLVVVVMDVVDVVDVVGAKSVDFGSMEDVGGYWVGA